MNDQFSAREFAKELEAELPSTLKCLERIPPELFSWKPHERSMELPYLSILAAEIDYGSVTLQGLRDQSRHFPTYQTSNNERSGRSFTAKRCGSGSRSAGYARGAAKRYVLFKSWREILLQSTKKERVASNINHMVHHRGQLTVYMRLTDIAVPSIYGPTADDKNLQAAATDRLRLRCC